MATYRPLELGERTDLCVGFFISGMESLRTRIYIDGYNLYFGCLKGTPYKWLNPVSLSEKLLTRSGAPNSKLDPLAVKFFTAEISQRAAADSNSLNDQRAYHLALKLHLGDRLETFKGSYSIDKTKFPKVEYGNDGRELEPRASERIKIWKMEEKQSDVHLALEAVYDAMMEPELEQVVFVTNDTDFVPALKKIREYNKLNRHRQIQIGVVIPIKRYEDYRKPNNSLSTLSDWTIHFIDECELAQSQMPCRVRGARKSAIRPFSWFKYPEEIEKIISILSDKTLEASPAKAWKWLEKPLYPSEGLENINGLPCDQLDNKDSLKIILQHVQAYAAYKRSRL